MNVRALLGEVERLEANASTAEIPADRVQFAPRLGIPPDPWQARLLHSEGGRVLLNCCRQSGKSTMAGLIALHRALTEPGALVLVLAPSERQSKELFGKVAGFYRHLHHAPAPESDRKLGMHLRNGSRIEALPGTERTIREFSGASLLIVVFTTEMVERAVTPEVAPLFGSN